MQNSSPCASDKGCISSGINPSPGGNNQPGQVFHQVKPGVRFDLGSFSVTSDPSQELTPPRQTQNFLDCEGFGE